MRIFFVFFSTMIAIAGCGGGATVSRNQCIASDWQTLGYRDGVNGLRSSQLLKHQDACVEHGIIPDREGYMAGWNTGVREYCKPNRAFEIGESGAGHDNVCPDGMQTQFTTAYREGRSLYLLRVDVQNLEHQIDHMESRMEQIKTELVSSGTAQLNPLLTPAERIELAAHTQRLTEERHRLKKELPHVRSELTRKQVELDGLRQSLVSAVY